MAGSATWLGWMQAGTGLGAADRVLAMTPLRFDVSVRELLLAAGGGRAVVLAAAGRAGADPAVSVGR